MNPILHFLGLVSDEVTRVDAKQGSAQDAPAGDGCSASYEDMLKSARYIKTIATHARAWTWADILREEFLEVLSEMNREKLKSELVQVAAVCARWHRALEMRKS